MTMPLDAAFLELGRTLLDQPLNTFLRRVADLVVECVPSAGDVSITLLRGTRPHTVAFHGDLASDLDERQYALGFGPCLAAAQEGRIVRIEDTGADDAFADFSSLAARRGVRSVVSVGLPAADQTLGSINVYRFASSPDDGPGDETERTLLLFASYAAVALGNAAALAGYSERAENLVIAMASRSVIEQAKGVLMARRGLSSDEAFAAMTEISQRENRKLRDLATDIVASTVRGR
jgi:GAF domain-containing protein